LVGLSATHGITLAQISSGWRIVGSSITAQIAWQKAEGKPRTDWVVWGHNSGLTASSKHLVYFLEPDPKLGFAGKYELVAYEVSTGREEWRFEVDRLFRRVVSIDGGYALVMDTTVIKFGYDRKILWKNNTLPSRSIGTLIESGKDLFIPSYSLVYQLSPQTGQVTKTVPVEDVIAFWGDYALVSADENQLRILDLANGGRETGTLKLFDPLPMRWALQNLWPFTARHKTILLVYYSIYQKPSRIEAYRLDTGKALWASDKPFLDHPALVNDKLILYGPDGLEIYDIGTGKQFGSIRLVRVVDGIPDVTPLKHVWLAGYGDMVFINYRDTWEIVALKIGWAAATPEPKAK
jgi:outer membrane protein assembly factor BamB